MISLETSRTLPTNPNSLASFVRLPLLPRIVFHLEGEEKKRFTCWNWNGGEFLLRGFAFARTFVTGFGNRFAPSVTRSARCTHEERARLDRLHSAAVAGATLLWRRSGRTSTSFARRTRVDDANIHVFVATANRFLKR